MARKGLSWAALALLGGGYVGAMAMAQTGRASEWAERMDGTPVRTLALILLLAAIVFAFLPETGADS